MSRLPKYLAALLVAVALLGAACSSDDSSDAAAPSTTAATVTSSTTAGTTTSTIAAPTTTTTAPATTTTTSAPQAGFDLSAVEVADVSDAGGGVAATSQAEALEGTGYSESEYLVSGLANLYEGPANQPATVAQEDTPYTTRILVRLPDDPAQFSGRVLVEPFNTSGAGDRDVGWGYLDETLIEQGDGWIGVTDRVSSVGIMQEFDAERYADLDLISNGQAWDILSQIGALVKEGDPQSPLAGLTVENLYMTGYSQSGVEISTYASAIHPLARMADDTGVYDGYLVMARAASMTNLDSGTSGLPQFEFLPMGPVDVPTIELQTESDVTGFSDPAYQNPGGAQVRRPDNDAEGDLYRLYEISGAAHAPMISGCDGEGTTFPTTYFVAAAFASLIDWAENGTTPPRAERIEAVDIGDVVTELARDEHGNALSGVRSPYLDVPVSSFVGSDTPGPLCGLAGVETPLDEATIDSLYASADEYLAEFEASLSEAIAAGFLLEEDAPEILAEAEETAVAM